jgi:hypothetical protein
VADVLFNILVANWAIVLSLEILVDAAQVEDMKARQAANLCLSREHQIQHLLSRFEFVHADDTASCLLTKANGAVRTVIRLKPTHKRCVYDLSKRPRVPQASWIREKMQMFRNTI